MAESEVIGEFDWIVDYEYLEPYLLGKEMNIVDYQTKNVLVIGCGTSLLSEMICRKLTPHLLVSLDNDRNCIDYMKQKYLDYDQMKWIVYDLVADKQDMLENTYMETALYDIVVDKGTMDAILVEGSISAMLCEIYRVLKPGGVYFLCSLHSPQLLNPLLSSSPLNMSVNFLGEVGTEDGKCRTIALCRKLSDENSINIDEMIATETAVMNSFYQELHPLLTEDDKQIISQFFFSNEFRSLQEIHQFVFVNGPLNYMDYTYELFLEDIKDFPLSVQSQMTYPEFVAFLSSKQ